MAMWFGGIYVAAGVLSFAWGWMHDMDLHYLKWGTVTACAGLSPFLLYGLFGKPKQDTPPTFHEHP